MRRLVLSIVTLAIALGAIGGFATPTQASRELPDLGDIIVCVREPCP